jgi:K+-sensing histidine kinase KdpD
MVSHELRTPLTIRRLPMLTRNPDFSNPTSDARSRPISTKSIRLNNIVEVLMMAR